MASTGSRNHKADGARTGEVLHTARLVRGKSYDFSLVPDHEARVAIAERLGIPALRKLRFEGTVTADGAEDWRLEARLGATAIQTCVITLEPVTTRIDEDVTRRYLAHAPAIPEGDEVEMPEDDTQEPLPAAIDLSQVMEEALALALPDWPRAEGAELADTRFAPPGSEPLSDADIKPLAGLKALRDRMSDD